MEFPEVQSKVLCVDLDGTLLRTDSLHEALIRLLRARPSKVFRLLFRLRAGRAHFKQALTREVSKEFDLSTLPRRAEVESLIASVRSSGGTVELISAADHALISSSPLLRTMFDAVIGSSDGLNLKGEAKARFLSKRHPDGFAYIGNCAADLPIWRVAKESYGVNVPTSVRKQAARAGIDLIELSPFQPVRGALLKSMRLHQWLKNLLIFVPLIFVGPHVTVGDIVTFLTAFLLFGLLTSGTYLLNDMLDLETDRHHPRKRSRPIPSGELSLASAAGTSFALIAIAVLGATFLNAGFALAMLCYLSLTLSYSLFLKRLPLVDMLVLSGLFTLRVVAGKTLVDLPPSQWLLLFSIFFFLSLAFMKREVELNVVAETGGTALHGRGYGVQDRNLIIAFGVSSGVASLVVFALFVSSAVEQPSSTYATPQLLWGAMAFLSYWVMRMWLLTTRGLMNDDPIFYAYRERASLILGALTAIFALAAQLVHI